MVDIVPTGIEGLDDMLGGGFLKRRNILLTGGPGTGKTTFSMEFLYRGAELGEKGLYLSLEESYEKLTENLKRSLILDFEKHFETKMINIVSVDTFDWERIADTLQAYITRHGVKRVVIDPLTIMKMQSKDPFEFREKLIGLMRFLENLDCTVLITTESAHATREGAEYSLEEFIVDGVIVLYNLPMKNERRRALEILKMRGVKHSQSIYPFKITNRGLVVYPEEII